MRVDGIVFIVCQSGHKHKVALAPVYCNRGAPPTWKSRSLAICLLKLYKGIVQWLRKLLMICLPGITLSAEWSKGTISVTFYSKWESKRPKRVLENSFSAFNAIMVKKSLAGQIFEIRDLLWKKNQAFIVSRVDECPTGNFDIKCKFLKRSGDEKWPKTLKSATKRWRHQKFRKLLSWRKVAATICCPGNWVSSLFSSS